MNIDDVSEYESTMRSSQVFGGGEPRNPVNDLVQVEVPHEVPPPDEGEVGPLVRVEIGLHVAPEAPARILRGGSVDQQLVLHSQVVDVPLGIAASRIDERRVEKGVLSVGQLDYGEDG